MHFHYCNVVFPISDISFFHSTAWSLPFTFFYFYSLPSLFLRPYLCSISTSLPSLYFLHDGREAQEFRGRLPYLSFPIKTSFSLVQKEFNPVSELREEGDPPQTLEPDEEEKPEKTSEAKGEDPDADSGKEKDAAAHGKKKKGRTRKKSATEDWEAIRRAVVEASARSAFRGGIVIYPDGYWSEGLPSDSDLHEWDCLCSKCGDPESDNDDTNYLLNTWGERKTL